MIHWSDGTMAWGPRPRAVTREQARAFAERRQEYEARGGAGLREQLLQRRGPTWLWLATQAPMAIGRQAAGIAREANAQGVERATSDPAEAAQAEQQAQADAARAAAAGAQAAEEERRLHQSAIGADRWQLLSLRGQMTAAMEAAWAAERAEASRARAEAHWAALRAAQAPSGRRAEEAAADAETAEAEWVVQRARRAAAELAEEMVKWAGLAVGMVAATMENAEGADAAEQAVRDTPPSTFKPSARVVNFMGELATEDADRADGEECPVDAPSTAPEGGEEAATGGRTKGKMQTCPLMGCQGKTYLNLCKKETTPRNKGLLRFSVSVRDIVFLCEYQLSCGLCRTNTVPTGPGSTVNNAHPD